MRKVLSIFCVVMTLLVTSCSSRSELYQLTDKVVESLYTDYESYGLLGGAEQFTSDREYKVIPIGRLVNVRIEHEATDDEYENLLEDLRNHYKGNNHVNNVYRCQAGTIMIDCRN